jgi:quercetin dioxygenase-like cupin family protein
LGTPATIDRRTLLYAFGIASIGSLLPAQTTSGGQVVVTRPGEGRFSYSTDELRKTNYCKVTSEDSGGVCSIFEILARPRSGPPAHVHHRENEWYHVISGEFLFKSGDKPYTIPTGGSIWLPREIPHVWANPTNSEAKLLLVCQPGGFEKFFDEMGKAIVDKQSPTQMEQIMHKYGMETVGPPVFP